MAYDLYDFTESLTRVGIERDWIDHVTFAWGENGDLAEWEGGFVLRLKKSLEVYGPEHHSREAYTAQEQPLSSGPWVVVWGWCDTTGWGCQDGAYLRAMLREPTLMEVAATVADVKESRYEEMSARGIRAIQDGDVVPEDLNRWVRGEVRR